MFFFYNGALLLLTVASLPLVVAALLLRRKYRCGLLQKCGLLSWKRFCADVGSRPIWIHAVSVGEVMAAVPLIKQIRRTYPHIPVVLSTVTETGSLTARRNAKDVARVFYLPFDYPLIVRRFVARIRPRAFVALEAEIWPNLLRALSRQAVPSLIVSGRISRASFRNYHFFRFFFARVLDDIGCFCMQTATDAERIRRIGADPQRIIITGNIKFDQQMPAITAAEKSMIYQDLRISDAQAILIAGSTHRGEEEIIIDAYAALRQQVEGLVLVLAPRHPERFDEVEDLLRQRAIEYVRKTRLAQAPEDRPFQVILLDTIGELSKIYSIGTVVFIGGSLVPVGGHNVLEPAVFSKPVIFGSHMDNFAEIARILTAHGAAVQVADGTAFMREALALLQDQTRQARIGQAALKVILENAGALDKTLGVLARQLGDTPPAA